MKVGRMIFFVLLILLNGLQYFNGVNGLQDFHEIVKDFTEKKGLKNGFPPGMLKDCRMHISKPLHHIINLSL